MRKAQPDRANKNAKIVEAAHRPQPSEIRWLRSARERNGGKKKILRGIISGKKISPRRAHEYFDVVFSTTRLEVEEKPREESRQSKSGGQAGIHSFIGAITKSEEPYSPRPLLRVGFLPNSHPRREMRRWDRYPPFSWLVTIILWFPSFLGRRFSE